MSAEDQIPASQSTPKRTDGEEPEQGAPQEQPVLTEWDRVKIEHATIVSALNETPASFTARSAEGLAMYRGLKSHLVNGRMDELTKQGHIAMANRARQERNESDGTSDLSDS